jgi:hypothetical protein
MNYGTNMKQKIAKLICLAFLVSAVTSCGYAKKEDLDKLRDELGDVRANALEAHTVADSARRTAQESLDMSKRTEEVVNRSFKQSMRK